MASKNKKMKLVFGDVTLGVHGADYDYIFSYQTGGPESLVTAGLEWLYRTPKPTFWRATTDNDRGNKFPHRSAMWLGADMFIHCTDIQVRVDGKKEKHLFAPDNNRHGGEVLADEVRIQYMYETVTVPAAKVRVRYTVTPDGAIQVDVHYYGAEGLPELPVFGMRFIMPSCALGYAYKGLSGETYPDRMAGGVEGYYTAEGLPVTPYLVPQDCGVHMETEYLLVYRDLSSRAEQIGVKHELLQRAFQMEVPKQLPEEAAGAEALELFRDAAYKNREEGRMNTLALRFERCGKKKFAFSCLPYTAEELENATHQEELPPARRTVLSILGAVRGVGGIDSWGADVEEAYHIDGAKDIKYSFVIRPSRR